MQKKRTYNDFLQEFAHITGLSPAFDAEYRSELGRLVDYLSTQPLRTLQERHREFVGRVNWKFRLNSDHIARFYAEAAALGFTFHYHQKCLIQRSFDLRNSDIFSSVLDERGIPSFRKEALRHFFDPVEEKYTLEHIGRECRAPSKLRKEQGERDIETEIVKALFSAFMWVSLPEREMHRFFDPQFSEKAYRESFWEQLHVRSPHLFSRNNALHVVRLTQDIVGHFTTISQLRNALCAFTTCLYEKLDNYGFLAILIEPLKINRRFVEWEVAADIALFGEKHREHPLKKSYFRWEHVRKATKAYISSLNTEAARFDLVNEGFTYRDCFVLTSREGHIDRLLLLFQKNERDETPIPCPTCRSSNVQGNSYPNLGVRSWECNNPLCPDRSKYNRGKRYTFKGLVMQQAIDKDRNVIPVESVRYWTRDVVSDVPEKEIVSMLVQHYSMHGDSVHVHNWNSFNGIRFGRRTIRHTLKLNDADVPFWSGPFFRRYISPASEQIAAMINLGDENFKVLLGDSARVLRGLPSSSFDGAVTSPPYYNARDYAQWPNVYCYLHDMFSINRQVFRTLKPGALYVYNIFDYFDNENTVVFSAMGQRRMILSAYAVDLFRRIGFELLGNTVWDKGDIEGKRGFNAGNFSPYYQSPFNCWEHVLIFRKPSSKGTGSPWREPSSDKTLVGQVLRQQPVIKMVRGENVHGHTAPFPDAIPEILVSRLPKGAIVLDPFGGSLTTGRVAERYGVRSVCIERSENYCRLGLRMRNNGAEKQRIERSRLAMFR